VLEHLIVLMKKEDVLFNRIYSRICGAGSYYDGLKVGKPEEFDMDIVIRLPIDYSEVVVSHLVVSHPIFQAFDILSVSISEFTISYCYLLLLLRHQGLDAPDAPQPIGLLCSPCPPVILDIPTSAARRLHVHTT
jgi:hypothetical protein